uniref:Uncharacterized protein n=1 Tax=Tanacetum cinerariifolium TaxID=118510 RepID=A0A6L2J2C4_TANCI|nr:hypothetical protein [Tanacetum cinerariifolium]
MSSITAQQTKLDLELVPKENRLDIGKFNGRIPRGLTPREPTFQVVLDAIALTHAILHFSSLLMSLKYTCSSFGILFTSMTPLIDSSLTRRNDSNLIWNSSEISFRFSQEYRGRSIHSMMLLSIRCINPRELLLLLSIEVYLERLAVLTSFVSLELKSFGIENRVFKKQEKMYYPRFTKAIIYHFLIQDKTLSWRNKIRMHTSKDDYLISTLRFVYANESTQIYGAILSECLTSPAMKESKAYKTYLGYAIGAVPPKIARKFKKSSPSKKDSDLVPIDEEPITKGKRIKRSVKKSSTKPATGIIIREPPVETKSKRKEKVDVTHGKGIKLLYEVALTEEAQMKEVRKKSLRYFHKLHPSGFGTAAEKPPRVDKITLPLTSEGTSDKPRVPDVTKDESAESESESWGNDEDDSNDENDSENKGKDEENKSDDDKTLFDSKKGSNYEQDSDGSESDSEFDQQEYDDDEVKDEDDDDDDKFEGDKYKGMDSDDVQDKKADLEMTDAQQEKENLKDHSRTNIPPIDAEIVSPLDVHVHHEVPKIHTSTLLTVLVSIIPEASPAFFRFNDRVIALEKDVAELKKDPLHTQVTGLVDDHLDTRMGATREEFMNFLPASLTDIIIEQVRNQLPRVKEEKDKQRCKANHKSENNDSSSRSSKGTKSQPKSSGKSIHAEEPEFEVGNTNTPQGQEGNQEEPTQIWLMTLSASTSTDKSLKEFDELMSTLIDFSSYILYGLKIENLTQEILLGPTFTLLKEGGEYLFDLSKPLPLITHGNRQSVPVEFFINNDLKYLQGGISTMTYTTSTSKTKAAQYDLSGIKDMVPNIWITHVLVMRKHRYGYLEEIVVRRVDNALYKFKEGDFLRIWINDIEDMLLLVVQNRLTNLLGDDVADFAIALRMFTRSLVIQKLLSSLKDITNNIDMEYLKKRRWSILEKKRAHFMIKDVNKLLKERRKMRSLEKFVGGKLYGIDLRLLQRTT